MSKLFTSILFTSVFLCLLPMHLVAQYDVGYLHHEINAVEDMKLKVCLQTDKSDLNPATDFIAIAPMEIQGPHFPALTKQVVHFDESIECVEFYIPKSPNAFFQSHYLFGLQQMEGSTLQPKPKEDVSISIASTPSSRVFAKHDLVFRGIDNAIDPDGSDKVVLTTMATLKQGDRFSITNANYREFNGGVWEASQGSRIAGQTFTYVGQNDLDPGTNICFVLPGKPQPPLLRSFTINGMESDDQFVVTDLNPGSERLELSDSDPGNLYLFQGGFNASETGTRMTGSIVDALVLGQTRIDYLLSGIPPGFEKLRPITDAPGSTSGHMPCIPGETFCEYLAQLLSTGNWVTFEGSKQDDLANASVCFDICDLEECDEPDTPTLGITQEGDCTLQVHLASLCDNPMYYNWQELVEGEWVNVEGNTYLRNIPSFTPQQNKTYRLKVRCEDGCDQISNEITSNCTPCNSRVFVGYSGECTLYAITENCNTPDYQWQVLTETGYVDVPGETEASISPKSEGVYRARVSNCGCVLFSDPLNYFNTLDVSSTPVYSTTCDYLSPCLPSSAEIIEIFSGEGNLSSFPEFNFPYCVTTCGNGLPNVDALVSDLNTWMQQNGHSGNAIKLTNQCEIYPKIFISQASLVFESAQIFNNGNNYTQDFDESNCSGINPSGSVEISINLPCDDGQIEWSNGVTTASQIVTPQGAYAVEVNCPSGCQFVGDIVFDELPEYSIAGDGQSIAVESVGKVGNWKAFPIPAREILNIELESSSDKAVQFEILDARGAVVVQWNQNLQKGNNSFSLELNDRLASGFYYLRMANQQDYAPLKFIIQKE